MPFSSISIIFIHILAPVLGNTTILKNAGKQHFAGVSPCFTYIWYHTESFFALSNKKSKNCRSESTGPKNQYVARHALHILHFFVNNHFLHYSKYYLPIIVNLIYYHFPNYPYYTNYSIASDIQFTTIISILQYWYHIVTIL